MKAFHISEEQMGAVIGALVADELSWRFRRHMDYLTIASISQSTTFGGDGLDLDDNQYAACVERVAAFFGVEAKVLAQAPAERLRDWVQRISGAISRSMSTFTFTPAGRDSAKESITHRADEIYGDAAAASNLLYGRRRLISLVAPHSLMGFVLTILTPNLQQIPTVDARGMPPEALNKMLEFGDVVVATPSLWRFLVREGLTAPDNTMGVYFGERMSPELVVDMRKAGFGAQREIYGSTETGLIGWRDNPGEPFVLFDWFRRDADMLARHSPNGDARTITPMDALEWDTDRRFRLGGRRDGAVQVGAVNVFPEKISRVIDSHPAVYASEVRVGRHERGYNRLIVHIVLRESRTPSESVVRDIDQWVRTRLHPHERPRIYNFESELPAATNRSGDG